MACLVFCGLLTLPGFLIEEMSEVEKLAAQTLQVLIGTSGTLDFTGEGTEPADTSPSNKLSESSERTAKRLWVKSAGLHGIGLSALATRN